MWGPSCLPAYPLGVLREPSCAPGQLIILAHDFSSPPPPSISHILCREKASTGHVWLVLVCSVSSSCHACSHLLHSAVFVPISHVIERVGRPMEGAGSSAPTGVLYHAYPCMPNLQFLLPPCAYWAASEKKAMGKGVLTFIPALEFWEWPMLWSQNPSHYSCFLSSLSPWVWEYCFSDPRA